MILPSVQVFSMKDLMNAANKKEFDRLFVEASRLSRRHRRMNRESRGEFFDLSKLVSLPAPTTSRKVLYLILLLCLKDRASELYIEPCETETAEEKLRLRYVIEGESYDLVPPPSFLAPVLSEGLKHLSGLRSPRGRIGDLFRSLARRIDGQPLGPTSGKFRIGNASHASEITATFHPGPIGERIVLEISEVDPALSQSIHAGFPQLFAKWDLEEPDQIP